MLERRSDTETADDKTVPLYDRSRAISTKVIVVDDDCELHLSGETTTGIKRRRTEQLNYAHTRLLILRLINLISCRATNGGSAGIKLLSPT